MNGGQGSDAAHDAIGGTYREYRRPDARIAGAITRALGDARTAVNVGAGAGAYEPRDRSVVAVEPSLTMIRQRPGGQRAHRAGVGAPTPIQGRHLRGGAGGVDRAPLARACPEPHRARARGARSRCRRDLGSIERRVLAHRRVFPGDRGDRPTDLPDDGGASTDTRPRGGSTLPIPHDCSDGFLGAYWRRPRAYLDAGVRSAISTFTKLRDSEPGLVRLRKDIEDGTWERRYGHILNEGELDLGYRIAIASVERA